jgi:hypothetical protein
MLKTEMDITKTHAEKNMFRSSNNKPVIIPNVFMMINEKTIMKREDHVCCLAQNESCLNFVIKLSIRLKIDLFT